jgi:sigma-B regulation protein RsbU (phosphoserine phosphatase)
MIGSDEMLVLYTDGITEARDADGAMFGDESLLETVQRFRHTPVRRMPDRIVGSVMRFAQGSLRDDTIVLCVSRASGADAATEPS